MYIKLVLLIMTPICMSVFMSCQRHVKIMSPEFDFCRKGDAFHISEHQCCSEIRIIIYFYKFLLIFSSYFLLILQASELKFRKIFSFFLLFHIIYLYHKLFAFNYKKIPTNVLIFLNDLTFSWNMNIFAKSQHSFYPTPF